MSRALQLLVVFALVALAWTAGRAQSENRGDFEIEIESDWGAKLVCVHGCEIIGSRDVTTSPPKLDYKYSCSQGPCRAKIHGFIKREATRPVSR